MSERTRRLFFALWPDQATRDRFATAAAELAGPAGGRIQRPDQLHVTLAFLGSVPDSRLEVVLDAGRQVVGRPLQVTFNRLDFWPRPKVLCLTATETPPELHDLVESLNRALQARGFDTEERPFRAHMTLARKVLPGPRERPVEPLVWPAAAFSLVESITDPAGARYEPVAHWPLR